LFELFFFDAKLWGSSPQQSKSHILKKSKDSQVQEGDILTKQSKGRGKENYRKGTGKERKLKQTNQAIVEERVVDPP
jgi:hypothetical protein